MSPKAIKAVLRGRECSLALIAHASTKAQWEGRGCGSTTANVFLAIRVRLARSRVMVLASPRAQSRWIREIDGIVFSIPKAGTFPSTRCSTHRIVVPLPHLVQPGTAVQQCTGELEGVRHLLALAGAVAVGIIAVRAHHIAVTVDHAQHRAQPVNGVVIGVDAGPTTRAAPWHRSGHAAPIDVEAFTETSGLRLEIPVFQCPGLEMFPSSTERSCRQQCGIGRSSC